tara:strand:+ start:1129 stop:1419 length:291 start_codon:yes stop_codon:yes gene_type:complete
MKNNHIIIENKESDKMSWEDILKAKESDREIEEKILAEIKKEGGALGMKNLKSIADRKTLKRIVNDLVRKKKIYIHTDGDIYTHKPESKRRGPFTA